MAYTYDNFTAAATNAGLLDSFSDDDLTIAKSNPEYGLSMLKLRQDYANATTAEQKLLAQEAENQLRSTYGGLNTGAQSSFSYGNQTAYQKALDEVSNYGSFAYDPASDPSYGAYKKAYLREADRATQDTMAQASAMSGGRPSTYAISAAQQAGNYYRGQMNDAIPALQQNAYQRYLSDYEAKLSGLNALSADRNFDYNAYLQEWNNALTLYQMGQRTPEILNILGITETPSSGSSGSPSGGGRGSGGVKSSAGSGDAGTGGSASVDMNSVINLGYGPVSAETLASLVQSGEVSANQNGGKITFTKNNANSGANKFGSLYAAYPTSK